MALGGPLSLEHFVKPKFLAAGSGAVVAAAAVAVALGLGGASADPSPDVATATPIKHVVVIYGENESFDHYFGTYPNATNPAGEPAFTAKPGTPTVNGLNATLLNSNPNALNPQRLDRSQAVTCSQNHGYSAEQKAFDGGNMDKFVEFTAGGGTLCPTPLVMDYYDGNTVTGLWNLAQNFALNDNSFSTQFGPSTVGAINLVSGQTHGATPASDVENGTIIGDPDPAAALDDCGAGGTQLSGKNVGDLLDAKGVSWGWFQGGFRPTAVDAATGKASCASAHKNVADSSQADYSAHHEPFEYYASTANPHHTPPASAAEIGHDGAANHQYDLADFDTALANDQLPAVTFLKAARFEDAHPSNSDPLDEQHFVARTLNALEASPEWSSTAVILAYDDSDGWYDHQMSPIVSGSAAPSDALNGVGVCGTVRDAAAYTDRCGYGPRQPLMVISPYAKRNYVDSTLTDQTSILRFIEDNWDLGRIGDQSYDERAGSMENMFDFTAGAVAPKVFLDPDSGLVTKTEPMPGTGSSTPAAGGGGGTTTVTVTQTTPSVTVTTPAAVPVTSPSSSPTTTTTTTTAKAPKLACTATGKGKRVSIACTATGGSGARTAVRFRIARAGKQLATASTAVRGGTAKATLKTRTALKHGAYTLTVTVSTTGMAPVASHKTVRLG
jgi:phospholipase C